MNDNELSVLGAENVKSDPVGTNIDSTSECSDRIRGKSPDYLGER